jgi:uncharacterized protein YndB with AHSA1/START domain
MVLKVLLVIVVLLAGILLFAASKPDTFRIQRSLTMNASPEKIFPLINDLHNWPQWAPQDRENSTMKRSFSGPESGVGAASEWSGSGSTGKGQMTITQSDAPRLVALKVDFEKPFVAHNVNEFRLEPDGASTKVTWSMQGTNLYMMKLMSVFTNMDRMMGQHFESGLANLKAVAER